MRSAIALPWPFCSSTSTSSKWSTTAWATPPATRCWWRWRAGCSRPRVPATALPASVVMSSASCSSSATSTMAPDWPPCESRMHCSHRSSWATRRCSSTPASASPSVRRRRTRSTICSAMQTWRCTWPSGRARAASRCSSRRCTRMQPTAYR